MSSTAEFHHSRRRKLCETNTYSWARLSRRTRVTRETNGTLPRERNIPKSDVLHLESTSDNMGSHPTE